MVDPTVDSWLHPKELSSSGRSKILKKNLKNLKKVKRTDKWPKMADKRFGRIHFMAILNENSQS